MKLRALFLSIFVLLTGPALALELTHSAGALGYAGGNYFNKPSGLHVADDGIGFKGHAGGAAYGGGIYYHLNVNKYVGLELDFLYESSELKRWVTINNVVEITESKTAGQWRIPLLLKLNAPTGFGAVTFGLGPEFIRPSSVSDNGNGPKALKVDSTNIALEIGFRIDLPDNLEIPVRLRVAYNTSQAEAYKDRIESTGNTITGVKLQNTLDGRLMVGVGYRF